MATRSRAKLVAAAADSTPAVQPPPAKHVKTEIAAKGESKGAAVHAKPKSTKAAPKRGKAKAEIAPPKVEACICSQGDDGTPMVVCGVCQTWLHFTCVDLAENDAEDISYYVCPSCTQSTGLRTIKTWEGPSAFEDPNSVAPPPAVNKPAKTAKPIKPTPLKTPVVDDSDEEESSEDEYIARDRNARAKRRRAAVASETDSDASDSEPRPNRKRRLKKPSNSPTPSRTQERKRKASHTEGPIPLKRSKHGSSSSHEDPTRKYCLGKLEELFRDIFNRYPRIKAPDTGELVPKPLDEMTEEEKEELVKESKQFADDLEKAIFETYADHDKSGAISTAGANYKDRFRTLQFNLSKPDRVVIHQRITSRDISAKDLSLMSSTDLANEETKQLIKIAEKEALAHSIIPKVVAPRAKMTHKGFEDIEFDGERAVASALDLEAERRREVEAEERRERERNARLRGMQRQRTASLSVPPESPTASQHLPPVEWGAPPPVPMHALVQNNAPSASSETAAEAQEPELPLGDLINIDEEPSPSTDTIPNAIATTPTDLHAQADPFARTDLTEPHQSPEASPFTQATPGKPTFDLGALWSGPAQVEKQGEEPTSDGEEPMNMSPAPLSPPTLKDDEDPKDSLGDGMTGGDREPDFDMLFEEPPPQAPAPPAPVTIETMPEVWSGKLSMPLDSTIPQETPMVAKQVAGHPLEPDSLLWKTLFPSDHLRIDGRVQVKKSTEYLTSMRFDHRKELYAVVFSPATEQDEASFKALSDFLIQKDRHGLVFPWTQRPKEHHPGKELYIIPFKAEESIPEYMELMDHLKIPKQRHRDYFVGIWVLNKGKLAPPTPPPAAALVASISPPAPSMPPFVPHFSGTPPLAGTPVPVVGLPNIPSSLPGSSTPLQAPPSATPAPVNPVAALLPPASKLPAGVDPNGLAAEVAALTPEQIQALLQTLQGATAALPIPAPPSQLPPLPPMGPPAGIPPAYPPFPPGPPPHSYGYPPHPPSHLPPPATRTWVPGPGNGGPPYTTPQYPPFGEPSRGIGHDSPPQGRFPPGDRSDPHYHRGDRDHPRGRGRGRGRKGGHFDNREPPRSPIDSGWPRKQSYPPHNQGGYDEGRRW